MSMQYTKALHGQTMCRVISSQGTRNAELLGINHQKKIDIGCSKGTLVHGSFSKINGNHL